MEVAKKVPHFSPSAYDHFAGRHQRLCLIVCYCDFLYLLKMLFIICSLLIMLGGGLLINMFSYVNICIECYLNSISFIFYAYWFEDLEAIFLVIFMYDFLKLFMIFLLSENWSLSLSLLCVAIICGFKVLISERCYVRRLESVAVVWLM